MSITATKTKRFKSETNSVIYSIRFSEVIDTYLRGLSNKESKPISEIIREILNKQILEESRSETQKKQILNYISDQIAQLSARQELKFKEDDYMWAWLSQQVWAAPLTPKETEKASEALIEIKTQISKSIGHSHSIPKQLLSDFKDQLKDTMDKLVQENTNLKKENEKLKLILNKSEKSETINNEVTNNENINNN